MYEQALFKSTAYSIGNTLVLTVNITILIVDYKNGNAITTFTI